MKNILVKYYSKQNFGDDLFVVLLAKHFPKVAFNLIGDPRFIFKIKNRPHNLRPHYVVNTLFTGMDFFPVVFRKLKNFV